jgi:cell wall-associated NlpC family hydrolase
MLNGIEQSCSLSGFGDTTCITGCGVQVKDNASGLIGLFYIDSDSHSWSDGEYTIDLELNFKNMMNEVEAGQDEQTESSSSSSSSNNSSNSSSNSLSTGNSIGEKLVNLAKSKLGCKYVWGATGPNTFDCSGLTSWCHKQVGISIPRTSLAQSKSGKAVNKSDLQPGDLIFWKTTSAEVGHVGMYVGNGQFIHAPNSRSVVKIDSLSNSYYASRYVNARGYY